VCPPILYFPNVTIPTKATKLVRQGVLVRVRLFPARSGKPDDSDDIVYLPSHVLEAKAYIEDQLKELALKKDHHSLSLRSGDRPTLAASMIWPIFASMR
jgi:hypothetical protein